MRGFTLIELLIVVAIIGLIAAVAIPNLLNAIDSGKQKRTMADLHALASAVESYAVDTTLYPLSPDFASLKPVIEPIFARQFPNSDAWGHVFLYQPSTVPGRGYTVGSAGKDGVQQGSPGGGRTSEFDCDIIFSNGAFVQWPEGPQQ